MGHYEDFEVWVNATPAADAAFPYTVQVISSSVGLASGDLHLDMADHVLGQELQVVSTAVSDLEVRKRFGRRLYDALFHGDVGRVWSESLGRVEGDEKIDGLRLRLTINVPQLAILPWELLWDKDRQFLANAANQAVSRYLPVPEPARLHLRDQARILLVVASPKNRPTISEDEALELRQAITGLGDRFVCQMLYNRSKSEILGELQREQYHILHFLGHGKAGALLLSDGDGQAEILSDAQFAQLVHGRSYLRLVVLNACHSSQAIDDYLFSGTGPTLVQHRIAAVVAMQYTEVNVATAITFSRAFYQAIANQKPVDVAVNDARNELSFGSNFENRDWSTPVLYTSTRSGRILDFAGELEDHLQQLNVLAQESEEIKTALGQLQRSLRDVQLRSDRLREWMQLERNLRELQSVSDGFTGTVKKLVRYASRPGWAPRETDLDTLELLWGQCIERINELDSNLRRIGELQAEIAAGHESLLIQRQEIDSRLPGLVDGEALVAIGGQVPKFADAVSAQLNQSRMLIAHELQDLRDMALKLSSRFDPEDV